MEYYVEGRNLVILIQDPNKIQVSQHYLNYPQVGFELKLKQGRSREHLTTEN